MTVWPNFVVVEGIDGCGKSVIVASLKEWAMAQGLACFDLRKYWTEPNNERGDIPSLKKLRFLKQIDLGQEVLYAEVQKEQNYDVILSAEPTYSHQGKFIREIITHKKRSWDYSAKSVAQAFALDRESLYKELILDALKAGCYVFQERWFASSFAYQPLQACERGESLTVEELLELPGNALAVANPPGLIIVPKISSEEAMARLAKRDKRDQSDFERVAFQAKLAERYYSDQFVSFFEALGSKVVYLERTENPEQTMAVAIACWQNYLKNHS